MKNGLFKMVSATTLAGLMFVGCGGGSSSGSSSSTPTAPTTLTGTFIDAQVKGLHYKTATQEGDTNEAGEFKYLAGETIEFKLGNLSLGSVNADGLITPYTLAGDTDISNPSDKAVNIALLLQNFDADRTDGILDVLKLKYMDLSTFSLSDTPLNNEGKISTKFADNNFVTTSGVLTPTLIDAQTAKTNLKNNVALSAIKYNKKFTQAYLDQVTLYQVQDGIIKTHQYRNGVWLFDDTGSALVPPIKHEGTYTIDANGELAIIDTDGNFNVKISTVTSDYIETTTSGALNETVKFYTNKSKAQAELTGSTISFVSGKTIVMNDQNSAGYMTLIFDTNGNYEERGFEAQKDSNNQDVPYTCYGKWKDLGNNKIAGTCNEGAEIVRAEVTGDVMGDNGEIHLTFSDKTLSVSSNVTVDFKNDNGVKEQSNITIKSVSNISTSSSISVASGFTQAWLEGRTVYYVQKENGAWTIDDVTFINGKQSYHGGVFAPDYIVNSYGIIRAEQNDDNTYQMYKVFSVDGSKIRMCNESKIDPLANFDCTEDIATQYYFTNQADAQAFVNSL